jgi:hypothetical protein
LESTFFSDSLHYEIKPIGRKVLEPVALSGRTMFFLLRQTSSIPQDAVSRIREIPGITPWLILCLAWHCPARGISAFQDGVHVLFAGGEITQDALR